MNRNIKRVAFALIVSASSFAGTVLWFNSVEKEAPVVDRAPIALLNESINEVQRQPVKRVIWENVTTNESLFAGDRIRTSSSAEAKIRLLKSGTVIHLEPDSLVILEENEKGLSLDFLEGNLFVQSADGGASDDITLKSGANQVKLNSADLSLSRDQSGAVNMAVFKGSAELSQGDKKIALNKETSATLSESGASVDLDRIQVVSPHPGDAVLLNLIRNENLIVAFKQLNPAYKVSVEWGSTRSNLKPLPAVAFGDQGKIAFEAKSGKWFMRLVANSEDPGLNIKQMSSNIFPVTINPKAAPTIVEPTAAEPVIKGGSDKPVAFRWLNRHKFVSQTIEVATDKDLKDIKIKKTFEDQTAKYEEVLPQGKYFWRVTGVVESQGKTESLMSPVMSFAAQDKWELRAPTLIAPAHKNHLSYLGSQKDGVGLKWQAPIGVKKFDVLVRRKKGNDWEVLTQSTVDVDIFRIMDPKPGLYQWRVTSWHPENSSKKDSEAWTFTVGEMPKVEWAEAAPLYEFSTPTPTLRAQWKPSERAPSAYRFRVIPKNNPSAEAKWESTTNTFYEAALPSEGEYTAYVEALNERGQTIAASEGKTFQLKKFLLLPAPNWSQNTPENLQSDAKGNLSFAWEPVTGADHYIMVLEEDSGKVIEKRKITRTTASFSRLRPGNYKVHLKSVDTQKRPGDKAASKALVVPATSDINAPKIKSMKVK